MKGSLKMKGNNVEQEVMEADHASNISKGGDLEKKHVEDLSEEEGVGAIQKWLEENSCPLKACWTPAGASEGEVGVLEISMEIF